LDHNNTDLYYKLTSQTQAYIGEQNFSKQVKIDNSEPCALKSIQLPPIKLPTFSGSYDEWLSFHDLFNCMIHQNKQLNEIQKFHYLQMSLTGDAANVILSLQTSSDNYNIAWNLIKRRFENQKNYYIQSYSRAFQHQKDHQ